MSAIWGQKLFALTKCSKKISSDTLFENRFVAVTTDALLAAKKIQLSSKSQEIVSLGGKA